MDKPSPLFAVRSLKARNNPREKRIILKPDFCVVLALLLLLFPLKWLAAWIAAAALHEVCHCLMIRYLGHRLLSIKIGLGGAAIETEPMRRRDEFLCAVSGPLGALLLLPFAKWFPRAAVCACVQTLYNLLPVYPLDGGRAVRCLLQRYIPPVRARTVEVLLRNGTLLLISLLCAAATFMLHLGPLPLICAAILLLKNGIAKIPCKQSKERVQ